MRGVKFSLFSFRDIPTVKTKSASDLLADLTIPFSNFFDIPYVCIRNIKNNYKKTKRYK